MEIFSKQKWSKFAKITLASLLALAPFISSGSRIISAKTDIHYLTDEEYKEVANSILGEVPKLVPYDFTLTGVDRRELVTSDGRPSDYVNDGNNHYLFVGRYLDENTNEVVYDFKEEDKVWIKYDFSDEYKKQIGLGNVKNNLEPTEVTLADLNAQDRYSTAIHSVKTEEILKQGGRVEAVGEYFYLGNSGVNLVQIDPEYKKLETVDLRYSSPKNPHIIPVQFNRIISFYEIPNGKVVKDMLEENSQPQLEWYLALKEEVVKQHLALPYNEVGTINLDNEKIKFSVEETGPQNALFITNLNEVVPRGYKLAPMEDFGFHDGDNVRYILNGNKLMVSQYGDSDTTIRTIPVIRDDESTLESFLKEGLVFYKGEDLVEFTNVESWKKLLIKPEHLEKVNSLEISELVVDSVGEKIATVTINGKQTQVPYTVKEIEEGIDIPVGAIEYNYENLKSDLSIFNQDEIVTVILGEDEEFHNGLKNNIETTLYITDNVGNEHIVPFSYNSRPVYKTRSSSLQSESYENVKQTVEERFAGPEDVYFVFFKNGTTRLEVENVGVYEVETVNHKVTISFTPNKDYVGAGEQVYLKPVASQEYSGVIGNLQSIYYLPTVKKTKVFPKKASYLVDEEILQDNLVDLFYNDDNAIAKVTLVEGEELSTKKAGVFTAKMIIENISGGTINHEYSYVVKHKTPDPIGYFTFYKGDKPYENWKEHFTNNERIRSIVVVDGFDTSEVTTHKMVALLITFDDDTTMKLNVNYEVKDKVDSVEIKPILDLSKVVGKLEFYQNDNVAINFGKLFDSTENVAEFEIPRGYEISTKEVGTFETKFKVIFNDGSSRLLTVPYAVKTKSITWTEIEPIPHITWNKEKMSYTQDEEVNLLATLQEDFKEYKGTVEMIKDIDTSVVGEDKEGIVKFTFANGSSRTIKFLYDVKAKETKETIIKSLELKDEEFVFDITEEINFLDFFVETESILLVKPLEELSQEVGTHKVMVEVTFKDGSKETKEITYVIVDTKKEDKKTQEVKGEQQVAIPNTSDGTNYLFYVLFSLSSIVLCYLNTRTKKQLNK